MKYTSPFYWLPTQLISQTIGSLTEYSKNPQFQKLAIRTFAKYYRVNTDEAEYPFSHYSTLADFFIRRLKPQARPLATSDFVSPVDGTLSMAGNFSFQHPQAVQAKGKTYSLEKFVGSTFPEGKEGDGAYYTWYLAPYNYHRIHVPMKSTLVGYEYITGKLWPVNDIHVKMIKNLFLENERMVLHFVAYPEEGVKKHYWMVLVGALNVGKIVVPCIGENPKEYARHQYKKLPNALEFQKGQEIAYFAMGSTVILVSEQHPIFPNPSKFQLPQRIKMGESLSTV